jgi:hypothetical protein
MAPVACCRLLDIQPLPHGMCLAFLILLHNYATDVYRLARDSRQHDEIPHPHYLPSDTASCGYASVRQAAAPSRRSYRLPPNSPQMGHPRPDNREEWRCRSRHGGPPSWAMQHWLNYAYTPDLRWGDAAFCAYAVAVAMLALAAKERS